MSSNLGGSLGRRTASLGEIVVLHDTVLGAVLGLTEGLVLVVVTVVVGAVVVVVGGSVVCRIVVGGDVLHVVVRIDVVCFRRFFRRRFFRRSRLRFRQSRRNRLVFRLRQFLRRPFRGRRGTGVVGGARVGKLNAFDPNGEFVSTVVVG